MEIIHRIKKDFNDKTNSLKETGEEITGLRKNIKILKTEHAILNKRMNSE